MIVSDQSLIKYTFNGIKYLGAEVFFFFLVI